MSMLGDKDNPALAAKAAETEGLLKFTHELLVDNMDAIKNAGKSELLNNENHLKARLLEACQCFSRYHTLAVQTTSSKTKNSFLDTSHIGIKALARRNAANLHWPLKLC